MSGCGGRCLPLLALLAAGCGDEPPDAPQGRAGPLGALRDLYLIERNADAGGPFFLDRFESTRADWAEFAATPAGIAVAAPIPALDGFDATVLPMTLIDLRQARAFAHWRRCRLPRADEWAYATTRDSPYPWGETELAERTNTGELGQGHALPVGTFESGRLHVDGPYDLIGNVAEWTETVPTGWFHGESIQLKSGEFLWWRWSGTALRQVTATPALAVFALPGGPLSASWLVQAAGDRVAREVVGASFATRMSATSQLRFPSENSNTIGVRLCTTPGELLLALAAPPRAYDPAAREQLRRFAARKRHAAVLIEELQQLQLEPAARAFLLEFLR